MYSCQEGLSKQGTALHKGQQPHSTAWWPVPVAVFQSSRDVEKETWSCRRQPITAGGQRANLIPRVNKKDTDPRVLEKQELQQPTYVALSYINRFMTDAARREQESLKKKIQPKLSLTLSSSVSRGNVSTPPRHSSGSLTPPVTPPITPSSSFRSSTPTGSEYDEEEVDYEESDSDESWTTESAISSEAILSSMCMNGGEEKPFACPVPGCKKRYKNVNGIKYHAKNGHRTQIRVRKPFKCRCEHIKFESDRGFRTEDN
ncbi:juxtaposed with another zinc finger protein 1 isoform X2 [Myotis myotis]|uniref:juxtaposed with another zinc finger protein 1 isoform X2 n=1 Tax=Myotis myotis TaxID=51298 RepID=UPI00174921F0|nr:juxtaposed with another zinc finger protein 1 isoform X2 [Myotis myotis]